MKSKNLGLFTLLIALLSNLNEAFCQRWISLEAQGNVAANLVLVPELYSSGMSVKGGFGGSGGLGFKVNALRYLAIRAGIQLWSKHIEARYELRVRTSQSSIILANVTDKGSFQYAGLYAMLLFERKKFFIGGGLQFSVFNTYKGELRVESNTGLIVINDEDSPQFLLASNTNHQVDMVVMIGFRVSLNDKFFIKPTLSAGIPFIALFEPDEDIIDSDFLLNAPWFNLGFILELPLKDIGDRKSKPQKSKPKKLEPIKRSMPEEYY